MENSQNIFIICTLYVILILKLYNKYRERNRGQYLVNNLLIYSHFTGFLLESSVSLTSMVCDRDSYIVCARADVKHDVYCRYNAIVNIHNVQHCLRIYWIAVKYSNGTFTLRSGRLSNHATKLN